MAFGNPLLDTIIHTTDDTLLLKYDIPVNSQKELNYKEMNQLIAEIEGMEKTVTLGGCSQNFLRAFQWIMNNNCETVIVGSIGNDEVAEKIKVLLNADHVNSKYIVHKTQLTGRTVCIVNGSDRSIVAYVGAAAELPLEDLLAIEDLEDYIKKANYIYIEGFFLPNREESTDHILNICEEHNKIVVANICGVYLCTLCPNALVDLITRADIVIGNVYEYEALGRVMDHQSADSLADYLVKNTKNKICQYGTIVIITRGGENGKCVYGEGKILEFEVTKISDEEFKDTIGAGDAFAAGFLAGLCQNKTLIQCCTMGCYTAGSFIKQIGCKVPKFPPQPVL